MMSVDDLMASPVVQADPGEATVEVVRRMHQHRVGSVVVTKDDRVVGIITERDALGHQAAGTPDEVPVGEVMTAPADCVAEGTPAADALVLLRERGYRHMPVADAAGVLVGMVSLRDLARVARIGPDEVPRGLRGVVVTDTELGDVRGEEGFYHYRQYSAVDLAASRSFEDIWMLVLDGRLPASRSEAEAFAADVRARRHLPLRASEVIAAIAGTGEPLPGLAAVLPVLGAELGHGALTSTDPSTRRDQALSLAAAVPTALCALHRRGQGQAPIEPRDDLSNGANLLWMLTGTEPDPARAAAVDTYLSTALDHGFNASTFTARVVASTGSTMASSLAAATGALAGPLHGGAPSLALELLDEIATPDRIGPVVDAKLDRGERLMGFGHAVYRTEDPRSELLHRVATELAAGDPTAGDRLAFAEQVEAEVLERLEAHRPGRALRTNVEFYAGVVMELCGIPREMFTPTFTAARVVGWTAHVCEQATEGRIIRPSARYVGPAPPRPVPDLAPGG